MQLPIIPAPKITDDNVKSYVSARPISQSADYSSANFKSNCGRQIGKNQSLLHAIADYSSAKNKAFYHKEIWQFAGVPIIPAPILTSMSARRWVKNAPAPGLNCARALFLARPGPVGASMPVHSAVHSAGLRPIRPMRTACLALAGAIALATGRHSSVPIRSHCSSAHGSAEAHFWGVPRSRLSVAFRGASDSISASASPRRTCASSQLCRCSPNSSSARAGIPSRY
jgi:hypothetical protein